MKKEYYIITLFFFMLSCGNKANKNALTEITKAKELTKLEKLMQLPTDSALKHYDLSNESMDSIPNLSQYTILSLDLSHNQIDTIVTKNLPQKVEKLNLSYNSFIGYIHIYSQTIPHLKEIDFSYNKLTTLDCGESLYRILISHNDVTGISLSHGNIQYLDISYNPNFNNRVTDFYPDLIDTIVRKGIATDKQIYNPYAPNGKIVFHSSPDAIIRMLREMDEKYGNIRIDSVEYRKVKRPKYPKFSKHHR